MDAKEWAKEYVGELRPIRVGSAPVYVGETGLMFPVTDDAVQVPRFAVYRLAPAGNWFYFSHHVEFPQKVFDKQQAVG